MKNVMTLLIFLLTTTVACTGAQKIETGMLDPNPPPLEEQIAEAMLMNDHNEGLHYSSEGAGIHSTD